MGIKYWKRKMNLMPTSTKSKPKSNTTSPNGSCSKKKNGWAKKGKQLTRCIKKRWEETR